MVQNLQPVGSVDWSEYGGDSWYIVEEINDLMDEPIIVNVSYGGDRIVYPEEDGDWKFIAELEREADYFFDRTDELAKQQDEYFVVNIPGDDKSRYLFTEAEE